MDNDYTPHDAGNNTKQEGDKFYKTPETMTEETRREIEEMDLIDLQKAKLADMEYDAITGGDNIPF